MTTSLSLHLRPYGTEEARQKTPVAQQSSMYAFILAAFDTLYQELITCDEEGTIPYEAYDAFEEAVEIMDDCTTKLYAIYMQPDNIDQQLAQFNYMLQQFEKQIAQCTAPTGEPLIRIVE